MDIMKFFEDVGRIADALEHLADMKANGKVALPTVTNIAPPKQELNFKPLDMPDPDPGFGYDDQPKPEVKTEEPVDPLRREFLKSELRRLGVAHAAAARNKTLESLYAEALKNPPTPKAEEPAPVETPKVETPKAEEPKPVIVDTMALPGDPDPAPAATIEQARAALMSYTIKYGRDKGIELLKDHGRADKLSKCPPSTFAHIVRACREGL